MAPFRNPFGRKPPPLSDFSEEAVNGSTLQAPADRASMSSRTSSAMSIPKANKVPDEFKMSVVNDSGVYLPPSPVERKGIWRRSPTSTTTSSHRSMLSENEPFSISRESFESYRRSFDISAKTPVAHVDQVGRQSLDSRIARPRPSLGSRFERSEQEVLDEETFEEVGLGDAKPKKRGIFARFGDTTDSASDENARPNSSHRGFHIPGRKRGQSGQGAELGSMPRPGARELEEIAAR